MVCASLVASRVARAETVYVPVGARSVALAGGRVVCGDSAPAPFVADAGGTSLRAPDAEIAVGRSATLHVAGSAADCGASTATITAVVVAPRPQIDAAGVTLEVDAGRLTLHGRRLRGASMRWTSGGRSGDDVCDSVDTSGPSETCALTMPRDLPADPQGVAVSVYPAGVRALDDATIYDASGRATAAADWTLRVAQVVVTHLVPPDATVDVASGVGHAPLSHPEAVADAQCDDASCDVEGGALVVRNEHGGDATLDVHLQLRPHVVLVRAGATDVAPTLRIALARCPVSIASAAPLRGVGEQSVVVRAAGACARDADVEVATPDGVATVLRSETIGGDRWLVVRVPRVDGAELAVTLRRDGTVLGGARATTRRLPPISVRLELPDHGAIDFVPTNRDARVRVPAIEGAALVPVAVDGAYTVRHDDATSADLVRGVDGAAGSVALRFAYRDASLPAGLRALDLASVSEPVDRAIRVANLPIALGAATEAHDPTVELRCGDGHGHSHALTPGATTPIAFGARDTCRLVLHRERLRPEDGTQVLEASVSVVRADGSEQRDRGRDQRVVLRAGREPLLVYLSGATDPFDRLLVRVSIVDDEQHYVTAPGEQLGATEAQWTVVCGTDHLRILATAAFPTGLFRASFDRSHDGVLALNAGALLRFVWLSAEGQEFPLGLETGVMWLGVAGSSDLTSNALGEVAVVAGLGIGVPIANPARASQTSIALHAWVEYEVSRAFRGPLAGGAWAFVFGPSLSIGDVGASF